MKFKIKKMMGFLFLLGCSVALSEESIPQWQVTMVYEGGYSPVRRGEIKIIKNDSGVLYTSGIEYYEGEPTVKSGQVTQEQLESLRQGLEKNGVWSLGDLKEYIATDGFTYTVQVQDADRTHQFSVYFPELQKDPRYTKIIKLIRNTIGA